MLLNLKNLCGHKLSATDGEIGHVKDFYFDDSTWAVRYLVVDTGTWMTGRQVLLSPYAFGRFEIGAASLPVCLTKKQIENSPSIDTHRPVSRQYEVNYYRYYGWPTYWEGDRVWGASEYPGMMPATPPESMGVYEYDQWDDIHLRSTKAVHGYAIEASDGAIGAVSSFVVDDKSWTVRDVVVESGHWYSGKEVLIPSCKVKRVSYAESKVYVNLSMADIKQTAANEVARPAA